MKYLIIIFLICSCTITHRLERKQYTASVEHIAKEVKTQKQKEQQEQPQFLELKSDSGSFFLVPEKMVDSFLQIHINFDDVIVRASSRSLPERNGKVNIDFTVTLPKELQGSCRNVVVTPYLHKLNERVPLEDLTIRGKLFSDVQYRNYWQYERYKEVFLPDSIKGAMAYDRFIKYPYPTDVRLDSIIESRNTIAYYYTQEVAVNDNAKKLFITLDGKVVALDGSSYKLPKSDTLTYNLSSMLNFIDTTTRYQRKIIEKYAVVNDRKFLSFKVNDTNIIDTLGDNQSQLEQIDALMQTLINQDEFYIDSLVLTASASPEGAYIHNARLAKERAYALKRYLKSDLEIKVRSIPEDWNELTRLIERDSNIVQRKEVLEIIFGTPNPDKREQALQKLPDYKHIKEKLYPKLRAVNLKYDLRRVGMIKDTIHTTEVDTLYRNGVELLKSRQYAQALYVLDSYRDRNSVIVLMSLDQNERAYEILTDLPETAVTLYLKAIVCSRLGRKEDGRKCFVKACNIDPNMEYRGNLDPEIIELLKID